MASQTCSKCGDSNVPLPATFCPSCGNSMADQTPNREVTPMFGSNIAVGNSSSLPLPLILGLAGSVILFIGVFTPIISLPIVGSMNYFQNGRGDGVIILLVAILSAFLTLAKRYRFLLFTGGGSLAILALTFIVFQVRMSQMQAEMKKAMGNNPFAGLGDAMMNSVQISWGWAVLIIGAVLLIAAALVYRRSEPGGGYEDSVFPNIADKHVYIAIALIFVVWLGLIGYGFMGGTGTPATTSSPTNPLQTKSSSNSSSSSTSSTTISPEEAAYLGNVAVSKVEVSRTILNEPGVFGEIKNNGDRTLAVVEITIYFLDAQGNPVSEKTYTPVSESAQSFGMSDTSALKPRYSRKFGYKADDAPSDWAKKVNVQVTRVQFSSVPTAEIPSNSSIQPTAEVPPSSDANAATPSTPIRVNQRPPASRKSATVITINANLRDMPDVYANVVGTLEEGANVEVLKQRSGWYLVKYGRATGWIHGNTIQLNDF